MSNWDWVQWYYAVNIGIGIGAAMYLDGETKKQTTHSMDAHFANILFAMPIIGRVFGWW